jgi:hypothetical protein
MTAVPRAGMFLLSPCRAVPCVLSVPTRWSRPARCSWHLLTCPTPGCPPGDAVPPAGGPKDGGAGLAVRPEELQAEQAAGRPADGAAHEHPGGGGGPCSLRNSAPACRVAQCEQRAGCRFRGSFLAPSHSAAHSCRVASTPGRVRCQLLVGSVARFLPRGPSTRLPGPRLQ